MKILIIEDEQQLSESIRKYLEAEKYVCEQAFTYGEAMEKIHTYDYDCIVLDLMLPGGNGLDILREIKKLDSDTGVIIASAKDALQDKLKGLEIGADDYLAKPFHLAELSMRIYSILRRKKFEGSNTITSNGISVNLRSRKATVEGKELNLTKSEFELLVFLISNADRVISKSAMAEHLSGDMADMMDSYDFVYTHIKNLKSKLAQAGVKDCIKTVYGTGYKWVEV